MPELIVHLHLDQHVSGIEQPLAGNFLAGAQLHHFLGGDQDLADLVGEAERLGAALERIGHLLLEARVGVDDVPVLVFVVGGGSGPFLGGLGFAGLGLGVLGFGRLGVRGRYLACGLVGAGSLLGWSRGLGFVLGRGFFC